jgi:hypothetical protein
MVPEAGLEYGESHPSIGFADLRPFHVAAGEEAPGSYHEIRTKVSFMTRSRALDGTTRRASS